MKDMVTEHYAPAPNRQHNLKPLWISKAVMHIHDGSTGCFIAMPNLPTHQCITTPRLDERHDVYLANLVQCVHPHREPRDLFELARIEVHP